MKKRIGIMVFVLVSVFCFTSWGNSQTFDVDKIEVVAVKSMQLRGEGDNYYMDIVINMRNSNPKTLKLKENNFVIYLGADKEKEIRLGVAKPDEIILESKIDPAEPSIEVRFPVDLGSDKDEVFKKLAYITNTVGNPGNNVKISINGSCTIGTKTKKGWFSQSGFEMELTFNPKIQREVLFE